MHLVGSSNLLCGKDRNWWEIDESSEEVAPLVYFVIFIDSFIKKPSSCNRAVSDVC